LGGVEAFERERRLRETGRWDRRPTGNKPLSIS
jgi:hypothetical protein